MFTVSRRGRNNPFVAPQLYFLTRTNSLTAFVLLVFWGFFFCFKNQTYPRTKSCCPSSNRGANDRLISSLVDECFLPSHTFKSSTAQCLFIERAQVVFFVFFPARETHPCKILSFQRQLAGTEPLFPPQPLTHTFFFFFAFDQHVTCTTPQ